MNRNLVALGAVALSALAAATAPASATINLGDSLDVQYNWGGIYADTGYFAYTGAGQSVSSAGITTVILGGDAVVFANDQSGLDGNVFSNSAPFNGPILTDVTNASAFSGWTVTSATAVYTSSFLTSGSIGVNWSGQIYDGGDVVIGASGVPEPSTWAMLMLGFASLGFAGYRKGNGATAFAA